MATVSNLALLNTLRRTRLLSLEQLAQLERQFPDQLVSARTVARALLQHGWLNVFQINELLRGKGDELVVGPYHVLDRLGQGGQSTVYKARHSRDGHIVALKVIKEELLSDSATTKQFLREMEAMITLDHPNIVKVFDADTAGGKFYCALEYVEGTDLGKYVRLTGPLPVVEAANYIRQAALGLQHAHEHNLIHRDIKPQNLFLTMPNHTIKILDWGLASLDPPGQAERESASEGTQSLIGTADYLAPEQAIHPDEVDIRADIYSLGCTMYFLLTGRPPFPDGKVMQKIVAHQQQEPPSLTALRPDVPEGLAAIVHRMLAKKPGDRPGTPLAVAAALRPFCRASLLLSRPTPRRDDGQAAPSPMPVEVPKSRPSQPDDSTFSSIGKSADTLRS